MGGLIGAVAWVMISFTGIEGVKMISNLGGFPVLFLVVFVGLGLLKVAFWKTN